MTADVLSLRARWERGKIRYRMVDEYEEKYEISPESSDEPLTFLEMVQLIDQEGLPDRVRNMNYECQLDRAAAERLATIVHTTSEFYPELEGYYEIQADAWMAGARASVLGVGESLAPSERPCRKSRSATRSR